GVGVAVAVEVATLIDGHAAYGELQILPFAGVEASEEDLLCVPLAALVREEDAGREREELGRVLARDAGELADVHADVRGADVRLCGPADHRDHRRLGGRWLRRRRRRDHPLRLGESRKGQEEPEGHSHGWNNTRPRRQHMASSRASSTHRTVAEVEWMTGQ